MPKKSTYDLDPERHRQRKKNLYHGNEECRQAIMGRIRKRRRDQPERYLWEKARRRAQQRGVDFTIAISDITIPDTCPVLGIPVSVLSQTRNNSATLDRRIPNLGYVPGNVAVISRRANTLKSDGTLEELRAIVRWLESRKGRRA